MNLLQSEIVMGKKIAVPFITLLAFYEVSMFSIPHPLHDLAGFICWSVHPLYYLNGFHLFNP